MGCMACSLRDKKKVLIVCVKFWSKDVFGYVHFMIKNYMKKIEFGELRVESSSLVDDELIDRMDVWMEHCGLR